MLRLIAPPAAGAVAVVAGGAVAVVAAAAPPLLPSHPSPLPQGWAVIGACITQQAKWMGNHMLIFPKGDK